MSFRLLPKSVTLNDLERRNSPNRRVISPNSVAFGADHVKVVEDTPKKQEESEMRLHTSTKENLV